MVSEQRLPRLEKRLMLMLSMIPGVLKPEPLDNMPRCATVTFGHKNSESHHRFYLEFDPRKHTLRAWPKGLAYSLPEAVVEYVDKNVPYARCGGPHHMLGRPFDLHVWYKMMDTPD